MLGGRGSVVRVGEKFFGSGFFVGFGFFFLCCWVSF